MDTKSVNHTPGPWRVGDAANTVFGPPNGAAPEIVASLGKNERRRANARLIASAPELLDLCRDLWNALDCCQPIPGNGVHDPNTIRALFARCAAVVKKAV